MIDFGVVNILLTSMSVSSQHDVAHVHPPPDLLTMVLWQDSPSLVMVRMRMGVVWRGRMFLLSAAGQKIGRKLGDITPIVSKGRTIE